LVEKAEVASEQQNNYQGKLEDARPDKVFRYVFLINNAAVEKYVNQSRAQAEVSFALCRIPAIAGFLLLVVSIAIGIVVELKGRSLSIAYIAGVAGVITQFISGVFFWMYNRTLQQINVFYQGIMSQQTEALVGIGRSSAVTKEVWEEDDEREETEEEPLRAAKAILARARATAEAAESQDKSLGEDLAPTPIEGRPLASIDSAAPNGESREAPVSGT
jgi:hypothetical protein